MATEVEKTSVSPLRCSPHIRSLLERMHALDKASQSLITEAEYHAIRDLHLTDPIAGGRAYDRLCESIFASIDENKCHFIYQLILATKATTIVEAGTGYGLSTIYMALAVEQNVKRYGGNGVVIATEYVAEKAAQARKYWAEAGREVEKRIELLEGDAMETLEKRVTNNEKCEVDFVLVDSEYTPFSAQLLSFLGFLRRTVR